MQYNTYLGFTHSGFTHSGFTGGHGKARVGQAKFASSLVDPRKAQRILMHIQRQALE